MQFPAPETSEIEQVAPAPSLTSTVPPGVPKADVTMTATFTAVPITDGSGESLVIVVVDGAELIVCCAVPALERKSVVALYVAVSERVPVTVGVSEQVPMPLLSVAVQFAPAPSSIVTVPVGVPAPEVTLAVTLIEEPTVDGFGVWLLIVVNVWAAENVWLVVPELARYVDVPAYEAVIVRVPVAVAIRLQLPLPAESKKLHVAPLPSSIVTDPVGVPNVEVTCAETVSGDPAGDGLGEEPVIEVVVPTASNVCDAVVELAR